MGFLDKDDDYVYQWSLDLSDKKVQLATHATHRYVYYLFYSFFFPKKALALKGKFKLCPHYACDMHTGACSWVPVYGLHIGFALFWGAVCPFCGESGQFGSAFLVPCGRSEELHKLSLSRVSAKELHKLSFSMVRNTLFKKNFRLRRTVTYCNLL